MRRGYNSSEDISDRMPEYQAKFRKGQVVWNARNQQFEVIHSVYPVEGSRIWSYKVARLVLLKTENLVLMDWKTTEEAVPEDDLMPLTPRQMGFALEDWI